jgi:ADP-ribose pyrophosphatase YjhB (NUDIX family)
MELGESTAAGAARETLEEAGVRATIGPLYALLNVPHAEQVHLFYLASMATPEFEAGDESLEVALFHEQEIPWQDLAFPTIKQTLEWFFADRAAGIFNTPQEISVRSRDILSTEKIKA